MIVKRIVRTENGEIEATLMLDGNQAAFLMNAGLHMLVMRGAVQLLDMTQEEFNAEAIANRAGQTPAGNAVEIESVDNHTEAPAQPEPATTVSQSKAALDLQQKAFLEACDIDIIPKA